MGISRVTHNYPPNDNMMVVYKLYEKYKLYHKTYHEVFQYKSRKEGVHYEANNIILTCPNALYESGFHCFVHKSQVIEYKNKLYYNTLASRVICVVHLWDIRTRGLWHKANVVVGKNLRIIDEI